MFNQKRVHLLKRIIQVIGIFMLIIGCIGIGYKIGSGYQSKIDEQKREKVLEEERKKTQKSRLSKKMVQDFLETLYTKKDLGENRNRYKPLVTDSLYEELVNGEEQPVKKAYKGYTVNQIFVKADIYIDEENLVVLCMVDYKNTQREKIGTNEGALINQPNHENIKLTYVKEKGKFLVNKIDPIIYEVTAQLDPNSFLDDTEENELKREALKERQENTENSSAKIDESNEQQIENFQKTEGTEKSSDIQGDNVTVNYDGGEEDE